MLAFYLAHLPDHGGPRGRPARSSACSAATFFARRARAVAALRHPVRPPSATTGSCSSGRSSAAVAVVLTGLTDRPSVAARRARHARPRGTRSSRAHRRRQRPVDPGLHRHGDRRQRGSCAARPPPASRARRWPARARRSSSPRSCSTAIGPAAFFLNAVVYGVSFLIYWTGVKDPAGERDGRAASTSGSGRYLAPAPVARMCCCWPRPGSPSTRRSDCGSASRSSSSPRRTRTSRTSSLMGGFSANQITVAAIVIALMFGAGLLYWGNRFKNLRRTTIILYGILGRRRARGRRAGRQPLGRPAAGRGRSPAVVAAGFGLFVLAGATPAALGLLADISERFPTDRGAIMGLYSVFLAIGQIIGRAHRRASRRTGAASTACSRDGRPARASPSCRCPGCADEEHDARRAGEAGHGQADMTDGRAMDAGPARARHPRRGRRAAPPGDGGRPLDPARGWLRGRRRHRHERGPRRGHAERLRHRRRRVLADLGRGQRDARPRSMAPGRAPAAADADALRGRRPRGAPAARPADDHGARRRPLLGRRPCPPRAPGSGDDPGARPSTSPGPGSRRGTGSSRRSKGPRPGSASPSVRMPGSSTSTGRTAGRGVPASGSACRRWPRRWTTLAPNGFDAFYDGDLGERQARGLGAAGSRHRGPTCGPTPPPGRPDRHRLPRRPGHDPSAEQLRARRARAPRPSWPGSSRRRPRRSGRTASPTRPGSISGSRRPSWRWPTATRS